MNLIKRFIANKEVGNASWLIGGRVIQILLSLLVGILTARYLGPNNYGLINYGTAYVALFTAFGNLGINSVIVKDFIDNPNEIGKTIGTTLVLRFCSSVLSVGMILSIVCIVDRSEPITIAVVALCSVGLIFHIFETLNFWFQSQYKSKITAIATLLAYVAMSVYKIVLLVLNKNVIWFAVASSVDYLVVAVFLLVAYKHSNGEKFSFSLTKSKSLLKSSYHYILSALMVSVYGQTDKIMLKHMLNESEVAYYSTAASICMMWTFVLQAIIDSLYPTILRLYSENEEAFKRKNRQLYAIVFYVSIFVSIAFIIFGDFGIQLLYGEKYAPAGQPLKIITWYTAFSYLGVARNAWIVSKGHQKYLKYMYLSAAIINVVLNAVFIPMWGSSGAAFASLITQIFTSIILPLLFKDMRSNVKLILEAVILRKL